MLIKTSDDQELFNMLSENFSKNYDMPYFSPSSFSDMSDCGLKLKYRKMYKSASSFTVLGNVVHKIIETVTNAVMASDFCTDPQNTTFNTLESVIDSIATQEFIDSTVEEIKNVDIAKIALDIMTGDLLTKDNALMDHDLLLYMVDKIASKITPEVLKLVIDKKPIGAEIKGYTIFRNKYLMMGILDRLSEDDNTLYITDYKTVWSSRSKTNWEKTTSTFQTWVYREFVNEYIKQQGITKDVRVIIKVLFFNYPIKDFNEGKLAAKVFKDKEPVLTVLEKEMVFNRLDVDKYSSRIDANFFLWENNMLRVGEAEYGCDYCFYKDKCEYHGEGGC